MINERTKEAMKNEMISSDIAIVIVKVETEQELVHSRLNSRSNFRNQTLECVDFE